MEMRKISKQSGIYITEGLVFAISNNIVFLAVAFIYAPEISALFFLIDKLFQALSQILTESERPAYLYKYSKQSDTKTEIKSISFFDMRIFRLSGFGLLLVFLSLPYVKILTSMNFEYIFFLILTMYLLWFLKFMLMPFSAYSIARNMPRYLLLQSTIQLASVLTAFSNEWINQGSLILRLVQIFVLQSLFQLILVFMLKDNFYQPVVDRNP